MKKFRSEEECGLKELGPNRLLPYRAGRINPGDVGKVAFKQILKTAGEQEAAGWDQLLSRVDEAGKRLLNQPSMATLRSYRAAVRDFLKEAIGGSYEMKGESRWDRRGNRRVFCVVQKINQALEELTTDVLEKNADTNDVDGEDR